MAVVFEAKIFANLDDTWFIELKDTVDGRVMLCNNLEELEKNIESLGEMYGGHVDEVRWFRDESVSELVMDDLRLQMAEQREKIEEERGAVITPVVEKSNS